jgi:hypothetical protein
MLNIILKKALIIDNGWSSFDFNQNSRLFSVADNDDDSIAFDFLINNCLLRVTLREYVDQNAIATVCIYHHFSIDFYLGVDNSNRMCRSRAGTNAES